MRKKPKCLALLIQNDAEKATADEELASFIDVSVKNGLVVRAAAEIKDLYERARGISVGVPKIRKIMREQLDMSYTRIINIPIHGNSERCLVQRQQCALKFLELIQKKKRIINIDESWLDSGDYRRRSWKVKGVINSMPIKKISPTITMMLAFDNFGEIYFSLLQANSDKDTMALFLRELIQRLDFENRHWRTNTMIVWDGAGYHTAADIK